MNRARAIAVVISMCICAMAASAQQPPVVLKGGRLLTVSHGVIENGVLVMDNGKI
nr:amidohydrolase [Terriglobales bacterium]